MVPLSTFWAGMLLFTFFSLTALAEEQWTDPFNRPDGVALGEGWMVVADDRACVPPDDDAPSPEARDKEVAPGHKLYSEISREIEERTGKGGEHTPKVVTPGAASAEISHGMLYLHFAEGQNPVRVQRLFDKKLMRLTVDLTPLYAMAGEDDRAWMAIRIHYLDNENRLLGEIRHYHHHAILDDPTQGDTIHAIRVEEPFDGEMRHVVIDAGTILQKKLPGVDQRRIARTSVSLEISSRLCGATVEGYFDNLALVFVDGAGLLRFTREELKNLVQTGIALHAREANGFGKTWIEGVIKTFGREKIKAWLNDIPKEVRGNPDKLLSMIKTTYGFTGQEAFDTAFVIQYLLHAM
ncbi:MAG: hypothetical protein HQL76_14710 [Magnetococcales bacterium]|nr:hypothetical protein [Magnetococcales bacterium]